jgi:hypothetical protein
LKKTSARKRSGGKTYYVLCDDRKVLEVLAMLRGYAPKQVKGFRDGRPSTYTLSPIKQLLCDN